MPRLPQTYTQAEFDDILKSGDRTEAIAAAYADRRIEQLPDRYYRYYLSLKQAFAILIEEPQARKARRRIEEALGLPYHQATSLIADVQELFPQLETANREFDRLIEINRLERLIDKIENGVPTEVPKLDEDGQPVPGEYETVMVNGDVHSKSLPALYKLLNELKGTTNHDETKMPESFDLPLPVFSTDINDMPGFVEAEIIHPKSDINHD